MERHNVVLLVIDMQNGFIRSTTEHIVDTVKNVIESWQKLGGETIFTQFTNLPDGQYERLMGWTRLQSAPDTNICSSILPYAKLIIRKHYYSAFTEEFTELVKAKRWDTFLICGIATDSCVLKTAVDAFELGFTPIILQDACASHGGDDIHNSALKILARFIGRSQIRDSSALSVIAAEI